MKNVIHIWNIKFNTMGCDEIVSQIRAWLDEGKRGIHVTGVNPEQVVRAQRDPLLRKAINESDIVNIDGILTVWGLRLKGHRVKERTATPDVMNALLRMAAERHESVYFLGAEKWVVENAVKYATEKNLGLRIVGFHDGFFKDKDGIIKELQRLRPQYLYIALPSPMKELFIQEIKPLGIAGVYYGVGGAFDTMGGKCHRAPRIFQKLNIEWMWRICQNPKQNGMRVLKFYPAFFRLLLQQG